MSFDGIPVVSLYSELIDWRSANGIGSSVGAEVLWRRSRRSHFVVANGLLSRMDGWITVCLGREATTTLVVDCLSWWMNDWGSVALLSVRR